MKTNPVPNSFVNKTQTFTADCPDRIPVGKINPVAIADCLTRPTSMTLDEQTDTLYLTELAGRVVAIPVTP